MPAVRLRVCACVAHLCPEEGRVVLANLHRLLVPYEQILRFNSIRSLHTVYDNPRALLCGRWQKYPHTVLSAQHPVRRVYEAAPATEHYLSKVRELQWVANGGTGNCDANSDPLADSATAAKTRSPTAVICATRSMTYCEKGRPALRIGDVSILRLAARLPVFPVGDKLKVSVDATGLINIGPSPGI
jgi:hypothetical protein